MGSRITPEQAPMAAQCGPHELVSFVGGGGKTTLMHAFAQILNGSRIATTTTKMASDQHGGLTTLIGASDDEIVAAAALAPAMVWQSVLGGKAYGLDPLRCDDLYRSVDHLLVEADGARGMPFKAPGVFEPVVPSETTLLVSVIGADALGRTIAAQCHRPLRVAALSGCTPYERLTPSGAATVLLHPKGQRAALPQTGRLVIAITKVNDANEELVSALNDELTRREPGVAVLPVASFA